MIKYYLITICCLLGFQDAFAQTFTHIPADVGLTLSRSTMADLDNDGYPELIQAGRNGSLVFVFRTFKNTTTNFNAGLEHPSLTVSIGVPTGLDAGDLNRDGFIDLFQTNSGAAPELITNTSPGITNLAGIQLDATGPVSIGDLEGDGDLDVLSTSSGGIIISRLKSTGYDYTQRLSTGFSTAAAYWANLDDDTPLEVIVSEVGGSNKVYNFDGTSLVNAGGISYTGAVSRAVFADFDSDGDMDFVGAVSGAPKIFKNNNGVFTETAAGLASGYTIACGDLNHDGSTDIVIAGVYDPAVIMYYVVVYINQGNGSFVALPNITSSDDSGTVSLADFDSDGDLDLEGGQSFYRNTIASVNTAPTVPASPNETVSGTGVHFGWSPSTDNTTPAVSLSYNIHVRHTDGTIIVPSHSLANGKRQIFKPGNAWLNESFDLKCLKQGTYYWKVQAVDASHRGGTFTTERSFTITSVPPLAPTDLVLTPKADTVMELSWQDQSTTETGFVIYRKNPNGVIPEFYPIDTVDANGTHFVDNGLQPSTTYIYRVTASNCAYPEENFAEQTGQTLPSFFVNDNWLDLGTARGAMSLLGDFDNDGDLDLLTSHSAAASTKLYLFDVDGNGFLPSTIVFPYKALGAQWFDYNADGFLDILLAGPFVTDKKVRLYRNNSGTSLTEITDAGLPPEVSWQAGISTGDYDLDGDEDLIAQVGINIQVYENNGAGKFARNMAINLSGYLRPNALSDFDKDGDLDILASQQVTCSSHILMVFENNGNKTFGTLTFATLPGLADDYLNYTGDTEWGDFDNDGYPDVVIAGQNTCGNSTGINRVYRNNGNKTFSQVASLNALIYEVSAQWGDYDNDGDLDVFSYGDPFAAGGLPSTRIYENDGTFKESSIDYLLTPEIQYGSTSRGDIDGDGDLDYVIFGRNSGSSISRMYAYRNTLAEDWGRPNLKPSPPGSPASAYDEVSRTITLSWEKSTDELTSQDGLTYNLWVRDESDKLIVNHYSQENGTRKVVSAGNAGAQSSWKLKNLAAGNYQWGVQAIDKGFAGSEFSEVGEFTIPEIPGVTGLMDAATVSVYPNPATHALTVQAINLPVQVELSSVQGVSLIRTTTSDIATLDLTALPAGLYLLNVTVEDGRKQVLKIVKQQP